MKTKVTKEGLLIPIKTLKSMGIDKDVEVLIKKNYIIIKPKSLTDKMRGIVKGSTLKIEDLDKLYLENKVLER